MSKLTKDKMNDMDVLTFCLCPHGAMIFSNLGFSDHSGFNDLNPSDVDWSQNPIETVNKNAKKTLCSSTAGLFFAQFSGGNLRQVASISLSFPQNIKFFVKILEFFL